MPNLYLFVGTKRGLFVWKSDGSRSKWSYVRHALRGQPSYCSAVDVRGKPVVYAGVNYSHWGPTVCRSYDLGATWKEPKISPRFSKQSKQSVEAIWSVAPDTSGETGSVYCGVAPAALFHSSDGGSSWGEVTALSAHPTRGKWVAGFGGLCLHTISINPYNYRHIVVGISAAGVFRSFDRGASWDQINEGMKCLPGYDPVVDSCSHKIAFAGGRTDRMYQQNHLGVYIREECERKWREIDKGLPSVFGFPMVAHPADENTAFVIPLAGESLREPKDGRLAVFKTTNAGAKWHGSSTGLPYPSHAGVQRDAFAADSLSPLGLYFGTTSGGLYGSVDEGDSWYTIANELPKIYSVTAAVL